MSDGLTDRTSEIVEFAERFARGDVPANWIAASPCTLDGALRAIADLRAMSRPLLDAATDYDTAVREATDAASALSCAPKDPAAIEADYMARWRVSEAARLLQWQALRVSGWSTADCDDRLFTPSPGDGLMQITESTTLAELEQTRRRLGVDRLTATVRRAGVAVEAARGSTTARAAGRTLADAVDRALRLLVPA